MKIVTKRERIESVRDRWQKQYRHYSPDTLIGGGASREQVGVISRRLSKLDLSTCSEADVDAAIGVKKWASLRCDECLEDKDILMRMGDEPDYKARWQDLCADCLRRAITTLETALDPKLSTDPVSKLPAND